MRRRELQHKRIGWRITRVHHLTCSWGRDRGVGLGVGFGLHSVCISAVRREVCDAGPCQLHSGNHKERVHNADCAASR